MNVNVYVFLWYFLEMEVLNKYRMYGRFYDVDLLI